MPLRLALVATVAPRIERGPISSRKHLLHATLSLSARLLAGAMRHFPLPSYYHSQSNGRILSCVYNSRRDCVSVAVSVRALGSLPEFLPSWEVCFAFLHLLEPAESLFISFVSLSPLLESGTGKVLTLITKL